MNNIDFPANIGYEFIFYLKNKTNNNKIIKIIKRQKSFKINKNNEIQKYVFILENEIIKSSSNIIDQN